MVAAERPTAAGHPDWQDEEEEAEPEAHLRDETRAEPEAWNPLASVAVEEATA